MLNDIPRETTRLVPHVSLKSGTHLRSTWSTFSFPVLQL